MKRLIAAFAVVLVMVLRSVGADKKPTVVFEATVVRLQSWADIPKVGCGVLAIYRLAEYRVGSAYQGNIRSGEQAMVKHLACNHNELDDLKVGDKVIVIAEVLPRAEKEFWKTSSEPREREQVGVLYNGVKVAKVVYLARAERR